MKKRPTTSCGRSAATVLCAAFFVSTAGASTSLAKATAIMKTENLKTYAPVRRRNREKYIEHNDYDTIDWGYIAGKQIVYGCPCNSARRYEQWIWSHRYIIAKYLRLMAEEAELDAKLAREVADEASKIEPDLSYQRV